MSPSFSVRPAAVFTCDDGGGVSLGSRTSGRRGSRGVGVVGLCRTVDSRRDGDLDCGETAGRASRMREQLQLCAATCRMNVGMTGRSAEVKPSQRVHEDSVRL